MQALTRLTQHSYGKDAISGISVVGLLLPAAIAYAGIANLPPQAGVIALLVGLVCYALLGSSRFAIVSSTSSSAAVLAASTASLAGGNHALQLSLAAGLMLITGVFFIMASVAKLGGITSFIAKPVLRGFTFALAVIIILKQVASLVSVSPQHSDLLHFGLDLFAQVAVWHIPSLVIGLSSLALLFFLNRFKPWPGSLIVISASIIISLLLDLNRAGVPTVGVIEFNFSRPTLPTLSWNEWSRLLELGFAMVLILYSESYGSIRNMASKHGDIVSPNRDLLALGVSNLFAGLFHGMPVGAGYSGTAANEAAGAQSKLSGVFAAIVVLIVLATLLPVLSKIPQPVLAAVVIHAVSPSLNIKPIRQYFIWKRDRLVCVSAIAGVLLVGILNGLLLGIALSLVLMLKKMASSKVIVLGRLEKTHEFVDLKMYAKAQPVEGMLIMRPKQALFFGNVEAIIGGFNERIAELGDEVDTIIISLEESPRLDSTCLESLALFARMVHERGKYLYFARLKRNAQHGLALVLNEQNTPAQLSAFSVDQTVAQASHHRHQASEPSYITGA